MFIRAAHMSGVFVPLVGGGQGPNVAPTAVAPPSTGIFVNGGANASAVGAISRPAVTSQNVVQVMCVM